MRKQTYTNYIILFFLLPIALVGQINERFIAEIVHNEEAKNQLNNYFTDFSIVHLPAAEIEAFLQQPASAFEMQWLLPDEVLWNMILEPTSLRTEQFNLHIQGLNSRRVIPIDTERNHTFKAQNNDDNHRLTVNGDFIYGYTVQDGIEWYIEPVKRFVPDIDAQTYIIYQSRDVRPIPNLKCGATERGGDVPDQENVSRGARNTCYEVELAIVADYSMYDFYGSAAEVFAQVEGVMNNVSGNFDNEFSEEISFRISEMIVSACENCDVWPDTIDASNLLVNFKEWGLDNGGFFNDFDLAQFWTRRPLENDGNGSVIGLAFVDGICDENRFHVLEDFTAPAGYLRVLVAHEIGHNFGCIHNYGTTQSNCFDVNRPDHIMDPTVSFSSLWSDEGSNVCTQNSILRIENTLANVECLNGCTDICSPIYDIQSDFDPLSPALNISWSIDGEQEVRIRIRDLAQNTYHEIFTDLHSINLDSSFLELCTNYEILIDRICGEQYGMGQSLIVATESESVMRLSSIQTRNCQTDVNTYDLDLVIEYDEVYDEGFFIKVGDHVFQKDYTSSPQFVKIEGLAAINVEEIEVVVQSNGYSSEGCAAKLTYKSPDRACTYQMFVDFDDCQLPIGWRVSNSYSTSSDWQVGDSTRQVVNFQNTSQNTTINGSCMAYFDDDLLGPSTEFSGVSSLLTPIMDFEDYEAIDFSLIYNFNAYYSNPYTAFRIDVFDGIQWVNLLTDQQGSGCVPSNAWSSQCNSYFEMDLQSFGNPLFQLRFTYSDGGQWAEFVALDDLRLLAVKDASILPVELAGFSARPDGDEVVLNWSTVQEINNDYFEIERSKDGQEFFPIGDVTGVGNSETREYYSFRDKNPVSGVNYYRLKQVDKDGAYIHSQVVSVRFENENSWKIYPNPVANTHTVFLERGNNSQDAREFQLLNTRGQILAAYSLAPNDNGMNLDVAHLDAGVYVIREIGGQSTRLIKYK